MFYWIALLVASCLAGCRSHSGETDMQTRMRTEIVTNVRDSVLPFWMDYAVAPDSGFYGTVLRNGTPVVDAPRGGVLNARILWSFSAAYRTFKDEAYLKLADKSQRYFIDTFIDKEHGGVYWLVNPDGEVLNASKYTYAMTYAIWLNTIWQQVTARVWIWLSVYIIPWRRKAANRNMTVMWNLLLKIGNNWIIMITMHPRL